MRLISVSVLMLVLVTLATATQAHTVVTVSNPAEDRLTSLLLRAAAVTTMGILAHFVIRTVLRYAEEKGRLSVDAAVMRGANLAGTAVAVVLLWGFTADPPADVSAHVDTPRHGGVIQAVGENHIEAVLRADGGVAVYLMGVTDRLSYPINQATLWATAQGTPVMLHASRQPGDPPGEASAFAGQVPGSLVGKPVDLEMTLPIGGASRPIRFAMTPGRGGSVPAHDTTPTVIAAADATPEEQAIFLKPGGAYTQADIAANGATTPEVKFAGLLANHHLTPKKGTYTCPITLTQANPKFGWIVGGKKYLFCCPPCIAEFVKRAKAHGAELKPPQAYIQQ